MNASPWSYGVYGGVAICLYYFILYSIDAYLLFNPWWYWGGYLFFLAAMIWYLVRRRRAGLFRMRAVTNSAFRVFLMTSIIYYIFHYVLYTWIDPDLLNLQKESILSNMNDNLREQFEQSLESEGDRIQWSNVLIKFSFNLIFGFLLSAFLAPIFKRDKV